MKKRVRIAVIPDTNLFYSKTFSHILLHWDNGKLIKMVVDNRIYKEIKKHVNDSMIVQMMKKCEITNQNPTPSLNFHFPGLEDISAVSLAQQENAIIISEDHTFFGARTNHFANMNPPIQAMKPDKFGQYILQKYPDRACKEIKTLLDDWSFVKEEVISRAKYIDDVGNKFPLTADELTNNIHLL